MSIHVGTNDAHMAFQFFPGATGYHVDDAGRLHVIKAGDGNIATFHAAAWQFVERVEDAKKESA
jgi:hypothetical protein